MCLGLTKLGKKCLKSKDKKYCHLHVNQGGNPSIVRDEKLIEKLKNQKIELDNSANSNAKLKKNNKILREENIQLKENDDLLKKIINVQINEKNKLIASNKKLNEIAQKYKIIEKFERMKSEIKKIFNWENQQFYIEVIRRETKYHHILEKTFNMSINDIIDYYYDLRSQRNNISHPFG